MSAPPPVDQATKDAATALPGALGPGYKPRAATPILSTAAVSTGTMITVPAVHTSGEMPSRTPDGNAAPIVGVNTVSKWADPQFWISVFTAVAGLLSSIQEILPATGGIDWRIFPFKLALLIIGAVNAFLRQRTNTVTK